MLFFSVFPPCNDFKLPLAGHWKQWFACSFWLEFSKGQKALLLPHEVPISLLFPIPLSSPSCKWAALSWYSSILLQPMPFFSIFQHRSGSHPESNSWTLPKAPNLGKATSSFSLSTSKRELESGTSEISKAICKLSHPTQAAKGNSGLSEGKKNEVPQSILPSFLTLTHLGGWRGRQSGIFAIELEDPMITAQLNPEGSHAIPCYWLSLEHLRVFSVQNSKSSKSKLKTRFDPEPIIISG